VSEEGQPAAISMLAAVKILSPRRRQFSDFDFRPSPVFVSIVI
jgi:hypothetical protein